MFTEHVAHLKSFRPLHVYIYIYIYIFFFLFTEEIIFPFTMH